MNKIRRLTYGGLMTALVFVATAIIPHIPVPFTEGYIHAGDSMIFITAILLGWRYGAIAGGLGSAMADVFLGYSHWALPTLIIKGVMGAIVGFMAKEVKDKKTNQIRTIVTMIVSGGWIVAGLSMKNLLNTKLDKTMTNTLINKFDQITDLQGLENLVNYVQTLLSVALILIPIVILIMVIFFRKRDKEIFSFVSLMGMTLAGVWMVIGYYIVGGLMKGNMIIPIFSVPANFIQFIGGLSIAFPIIIALKKTKYFDSF